jgi:hypothetical protein
MMKGIRVKDKTELKAMEEENAALKKKNAFLKKENASLAREKASLKREKASRERENWHINYEREALKAKILTDDAEKILLYIRDHPRVASHIAANFSLHRQAVDIHLKDLIKAGFIFGETVKGVTEYGIDHDGRQYLSDRDSA